jgi:hypothetical protein
VAAARAGAGLRELAAICAVILSFRVSQGCDLRRLVEDSVFDGVAVA